MMKSCISDLNSKVEIHTSRAVPVFENVKASDSEMKN